MKTTLRFFLVGIIGAIVEFSLFSYLIKSDNKVMLSNLIAFHVAFITCFFLHYSYTYMKLFSKKHKLANYFIKYVVLMYSQLLIGSLLIWFLINRIGWLPEVAKISQMILIMPISFFVQKIGIFSVEKV
jgi:putative flippase GtrA